MKGSQDQIVPVPPKLAPRMKILDRGEDVDIRGDAREAETVVALISDGMRWRLYVTLQTVMYGAVVPGRERVLTGI